VPSGDNGTIDPQPIADFDINCNLLSCSFDGSRSTSPNGAITQYEWQYGDGSANGFGSSVSHTYASAGQFSATLTITDETGATASKTYTLAVDDGSDPKLLKDGVAKVDLSGARNNEQFFYFDVPAGMSGATIVITDGSGDADLYVRKGNEPTRTTYDCRPYRWGNEETCTVSSGAGRYHVMLRGYSAYNGVSITATAN
jgi:PKD repeat protein